MARKKQRTVKELREAAGLSQAEVARRCGIDRPGLVKLEAGRQNLTVEVARKLAWCYEVSVDEVVGGPLAVA